jgi:predicted nucleotidyltransferase
MPLADQVPVHKRPRFRCYNEPSWKRAHQRAYQPSALLETPALADARRKALETREELDQFLSSRVTRYTSEDTSLVVFGSLARGEWTSGSDLDWTYVIDGQANSDHLIIAQQIHSLLTEQKERFRPPGQTGPLGTWHSAMTSFIRLAARATLIKT